MFEPINLDYEAIGRRAKQRRQELGLKQEEVAEIMGISTSFIGHIERAEKKPSAQTIVRLAVALDLTTDYLLIGVKHTCEMEECELFKEFKLLMRSYGIPE